MNTNYHNIDYQYVYFTFDYTWLRDKQIIHNGNEMGGVLIIADDEGNVLKMYGYERIR
jgi:hypothetical protein